MSFLTSLFGGSDTRSSASATTTSNATNQADNRVVLGNDAVQVGPDGAYAANSNNSSRFEVNDSSVHDSSSRYSYTGTDGGSVDIARFNAQLLQALGENQGETVKTLSKMGADGVSRQAQSATDLFALASNNASKSWTHTLDKSGELIDKLLSSAQGTITGAQTVARDAISSYQPTDNKNADTFKYAAIAGAVVVAFLLFKKA